jgi:hypothetical protein
MTRRSLDNTIWSGGRALNNDSKMLDDARAWITIKIMRHSIRDAAARESGSTTEERLAMLA